MNPSLWTRRQLLKDDRLTFVTTTESNPWQTASVYQPTFAWDMLNLNLDPATPQLDEKALEVVSKYRFKPAVKDGKPVASYVSVEVNFRFY